MINGAPRKESYLNIGTALKTAVENNPGYLFLAGVGLASIVFYWLGPQLILFTGLISTAAVHTLYPKQTEKWLKDHEFLFAGGAFGYLLGGLVGTLVGLWLGNFIAEKYAQAAGVVNQVNQAVNPMLHPITFVSEKMHNLNRWLKSLFVDEPAAVPSEQAAVSQDHAVNEGTLMVVTSARRKTLASPFNSIPDLFINFNGLAKQFVQEFRERSSFPIFHFPIKFPPVNSPAVAINKPHALLENGAQQTDAADNEERAIVLASAQTSVAEVTPQRMLAMERIVALRENQPDLQQSQRENLSQTATEAVRQAALTVSKPSGGLFSSFYSFLTVASRSQNQLPETASSGKKPKREIYTIM